MCETQTWCKQQSLPPGVTSANYQCVDFESGIPSGWTTVVNGGAVGMVSTARASSAPNSFYARGAKQDSTADTGTITWSNVGPTAVSSVTVVLDYLHPAVAGFPGTWDGYDDFLCVAIGSSRGCLKSTGIALTLRYQSGGTLMDCGDLASDSIPDEVWTRGQLQMTSSGVTFSVGTTVKASCSAAVPPSTAATVMLGVEQNAPTLADFDMYYDNVVAYTKR
jgi:hypothetical protein